MEFEDMSLDYKARELRSSLAEPGVWQSGPVPPEISQLQLLPQILEPKHGIKRQDQNVERVQRNGSTEHRVVRPSIFVEYTYVVQQYSRRSLTFDGDALRAVNGILNIFATWMRTSMLYGLPESLLDIALLWEAREPLVRRCEQTIPSWSWAGWEGQVEYPPIAEPALQKQIPEDEKNFESLRPFVTFSKNPGSVFLNGSGVEIKDLGVQYNPLSLTPPAHSSRHTLRPSDW